MPEGVKASLSVRASGAWGARLGLLWTDQSSNQMGNDMADDESILTSPPTQDVAVHVRDYTNFTKLLKYGAITSLIIGFIVLLILK
jgi:hypothetical protein